MKYRVLLTSLIALVLALAGLAPTAAVAEESSSAAQPAATDRSSGAPAARAKAKEKCVKGSTHSGQSASGTCYKFLASKVEVVPVESVPLRNRSSKKATLTCKFTRTVSKAVQYGASATSSAEANAVFGLAKISLSVTVSKNVTQTETQASEAGGSVELDPGEKVTCLRVRVGRDVDPEVHLQRRQDHLPQELPGAPACVPRRRHRRLSRRVGRRSGRLPTPHSARDARSARWTPSGVSTPTISAP